MRTVVAGKRVIGANTKNEIIGERNNPSRSTGTFDGVEDTKRGTDSLLTCVHT